MYKYFKTTIMNKDDIEDTNKYFGLIDGVEVQLYKDKNCFNLMPGIKNKVVGIHIDLEAKKDSPCSNLENIIKSADDTSYLIELINVARQYKSYVLVHCQKPIVSNDNLQLITLAALKSGVTIRVENVGFKGDCTPLEISDWCQKQNSQFNRTIFIPLLDTCHYLLGLAHNNERPCFEEIVDANAQFGQLYFHLSYGRGLCLGADHGLNFDTNPELLTLFLEKIYSVNPDAHLILEVAEQDYSFRKNALSLLNQIELFEIKQK